jgi:hypothetical protein
MASPIVANQIPKGRDFNKLNSTLCQEPSM